MTEDRPCACGGTVTADPAAPFAGVSAHNAGPDHRAWRRRRRNVETTKAWQLRIRAEVDRVRLERWVAQLEVAT